jgi:hypothetical protein
MAKTQNYHTAGKGTKDGEIKFGHINEDGVISAAVIRSGTEAKHYISLDSEGTPTRKHGTICRSTGSFQIIAGDNVPYQQDGIHFEAENGDITLQAKNGRIRILAENIDLIAKGANGKNGVININGNEKVIIDSPIINVSSKASTKIVSDGTLDLIGKTILDIYGGLIDVADGATSIKGSKGGSNNESKNKL